MLNRLFNTLFGKLFAGFCLVILLTAAGVWMAAYSAQSQQNEDIGRIEWRFIAHKSVDSAVGIYEVAGRDGLISWLRNERLNTNPIVFVLDSSGREISGRKLPDKAYESLKAIRKLTDDPNGPPEKRLPVRTVEIDNEPCEFFAVRTVAFPVRLIPPELHHFPIALTLSLAAFFTLLVSWLLARLYTRSLHTLDGAMRRFADGAFDTRTSEELARGGRRGRQPRTRLRRHGGQDRVPHHKAAKALSRREPRGPQPARAHRGGAWSLRGATPHARRTRSDASRRRSATSTHWWSRFSPMPVLKTAPT